MVGEIEKDRGLGMTSMRTRERLLERLSEKGIDDVRVLEALRDIPRHLFLDEALASRAYEDLSLPIGNQQTISQPYIVARMTEILVQDERFTQKPLKNTLEIGTGCGYQAAILSLFSNRVTSIERIKALYEKAKRNLDKLKIRNVRLIHGDAYDFLEEENFDSILLAAAPKEVPEKILSSLIKGGKLIAPVGNKERQDLVLVTRMDKDYYKYEKIEEVLFVPMLDGVIE